MNIPSLGGSGDSGTRLPECLTVLSPLLGWQVVFLPPPGNRSTPKDRPAIATKYSCRVSQ